MIRLSTGGPHAAGLGRSPYRMWLVALRWENRLSPGLPYNYLGGSVEGGEARRGWAERAAGGWRCGWWAGKLALEFVWMSYGHTRSRGQGGTRWYTHRTHSGPIIHRKHGYFLMTDQSDTARQGDGRSGTLAHAQRSWTRDTQTITSRAFASHVFRKECYILLLDSRANRW